MAKRTYTGADGTARRIRRGHAGVHTVPRKLYALLEYIRSTGTQYIDTEVAAAASLRFEADFTPHNDIANPGFGSVFGARSSSYQYILNTYPNTSGGSFSCQTAGASTQANPELTKDTRCQVSYLETVFTSAKGTTTEIASAQNVGLPLSLFARNMNGTRDEYGRVTLYGLQLYDGGTLVRDFAPAKRLSDGAAGLYDRVEERFYTNAGSGVFTEGPETGAYIWDAPGEGEFARRIRRAYIGVGGMARPFWSGGVLTYYGTVTPLNAARVGPNANSIGRYALFAGGSNGSLMATPDAYDRQLVRTFPEAVLTKGTSARTGDDGKYVVITGGSNNTATTVYDTELTRSSLSDPVLSRYRMTSTNSGRHAIWGGGQQGSFTAAVNAVDDDLCASVPAGFGVARGYYGAISNHGYAMFAGGWANGYSNAVDVYGEELEKLSVLALPNSVYIPGSTCPGEYFLIAGGQTGDSSFTNVVTAYSADLTRIGAEPLTAAKGGTIDVSFDGHALFCGGNTGSAIAAVECYDKDLTHTTLHDLSAARFHGVDVSRCGAVVGDFALIAGGSNGSAAMDTVDAFTFV